MRILGRIKSAIRVIKGGRWGYFYDRLPGAQKLFNLSNLIPSPSRYTYILLGGHGVGLTAVKYYLSKCQAKPMEVLSYENFRPFVFWRKFDGLVLDKSPLNSDASKILAICTKKVPVYQIVRDPIAIIKSNVNATMFHCIATINSKEDANRLAIDIITNIPHLMIAFASQRALVAHITSDVTYLSMQDISDTNMPQTMQKFCDRFGYTNCQYDEESVVKGSLFPRCFPYIFSIDGKIFGLSTLSRLTDGSSAEMDLSTHIESKLLRWSYPIYKLESITLPNYEQYPLHLVSASALDSTLDSVTINQAREKAMAYIESITLAIQKANIYAFSEETLIQMILQHPELATSLKELLYKECSIIQSDRPDIYETFSYMHKFLQLC